MIYLILKLAGFSPLVSAFLEALLRAYMDGKFSAQLQETQRAIQALQEVKTEAEFREVVGATIRDKNERTS